MYASNGFQTKNGKGFHVGELNQYSFYLHVSKKTKRKKIAVDVLFKKSKGLDEVVGYLPINDLIDIEQGFDSDNNKLTLTAAECKAVRLKCWRCLITMFNITPPEVMS